MGFADIGSASALGDFDGDGFIDFSLASFDQGTTALFRNNGNHWLRVELVGTQSNRNGIGARLFATAGELEQMREILGGVGRKQDEKTAHFGLGQRTQLDRLEIHWPSGQVDVLTDIPADQKIRVFEGRQTYHPAQRSTWINTQSDTLVGGNLYAVRVRPALFEPDARITTVTTDLREVGGRCPGSPERAGRRHLWTGKPRGHRRPPRPEESAHTD